MQLGQFASPSQATNLSKGSQRDLLFVSLGSNGLQTIAVSDASSPHEVGYWIEKSRDVLVQDDVAYVARNDRYYDILDLSNTGNIRLLELITYFMLTAMTG